MKSKNTFITNDTFIRFVYKFFKNFNFDNKEYLEQVKNEYFKSVENKELSMFAAEPYLRKIFMNNGFCKNRPDKISHWKSMGYSDINSIRSEAYRYCKNNGKYKKLVFDNDDFEIKKLLKETLTVFNFDNEQYYDYVKNKLFDGVIFISYIPAKKKILNIIYNGEKSIKSNLVVGFWTSRGFTEDYAKSVISEKQKVRSKRCEEYYITRGLSKDDAKKSVSEWQTKTSLKSKSSKDYWLNLGFDKTDAEKLSSEYSSKRSVWAKSHWINLGYTEEEANKKILEYNPSSISFKNYQKDFGLYTRAIKKASENAKERWKRDSYKNKKILAVKEGRFSRKSVSKGECELFEFLIEFVDKNIKHEPYVVAIPEDSSTSINTYFYACDGYLQTDYGNIIIIEYDGRLYHHKLTDEIRDSDILMIDEHVIGIIRISDSFFKDKKFLKIEKINKINESIQKIKNTTESRIML